MTETAYGKVFGIDSSNGDMLWIGYEWAAEVGAKIIPVRFFVTKTVGDGSNPEVVLVTQRRAENVSVLGVVWLDSDY